MKAAWVVLLGFFVLAPVARAKDASLPPGFGKAEWGMTPAEFLDAYQLVLALPKGPRPDGVWAVEGPSPGEITVSGAGLGERAVRSASFGFHPKWGLAIIHVRFKEGPQALSLEELLPQWAKRFGPPKERQPEKFIWEDGTTHIELTVHRVSELHPSPSDHSALVLWSNPLRDKIDAQSN